MSLFFDCIEPQGRPPKRTIEVEPGEEVALYVLPLHPDTRGLRRLVFRREEEEPPAGAKMVMWVRTDGTAVQVTEASRTVLVEMIRSDLRSQVFEGMRLPTTATLEVSLPDRGRVDFTLTVRQPLVQGAAVGIAGGGTRKSRVVYGADNVWWLITDSKGIAVTVIVDLWDRVRDRLLKMGVDSRVFTFLTGFIVAAAIGGFAAWREHRAAAEATDRAESAEQSAALSQAAREASLETELVCLEQRQELADALGEQAETRSLGAEQALNMPLALAVSLEWGGDLLGAPDLRKHDALYRNNLIGAVVTRLEKSSGNPGPCLVHKAALGADVPDYLLLWNPDTELTCPPDYESVEGSVQHVGRWGLSTRLAVEFGEGGSRGLGITTEVLESKLGDPRMEDRWSAFTAAGAFREVQKTVLRFDAGSRPTVMPSQAQLWTLALLDAYNRMPSPAEGTLDLSVSACVEALLEDRLATAPPAVPGEPLIPDIVSVAMGDAAIVASPTPGCPWPRNAMVNGTDSALQAAARLGAHYTSSAGGAGDE